MKEPRQSASRSQQSAVLSRWSWREIALGAALCTALITLAILQYSWIGQVAEVERARLDRALRQSTDRFVEDFNDELQRLALTLIAGGRGNGALDAGIAERLAVWRQSTSHGALVREVYLTSEDQVPPHLADMASRLPRQLVGGRGRGGPPIVVDSDVPAIAIPVVLNPLNTLETRDDLREAVDSLIVELDLDYIRATWLPELVARHYGDDYHVEVVGGPAVGVVYKSDDDVATAPIEGAGVGRLFALRSGPRGGRGNGRPQPGRFGSDGGPNGGQGIGRGGDGPPQPPPPGAPPPPPGAPPSPPEEDAPEFLRSGWRVLASQRAGPLGLMLSDYRSRNLAISFGMLLLMGVSVAMLMLSSRKSRLLADQQMEFVAGVTHELRTPLAVISSASQNLADGVAATETQTKRYGKMILGHSNRLTSMVEQILRFAGLASGRVEIQHEHVDIADTIQQAVRDCGPELAAAGCQVNTTIPEELPSVDGDPEALVHCLRNLLVNAAKHGGGAPVEIHAAMTAADSGMIEIRVADQGPGIDPADLPHVFEPFYRGKRATADQVQGSGLGLSLVKRIIEAHGGRVAIHNKFGQATADHGTAISLILPVETDQG